MAPRVTGGTGWRVCDFGFQADSGMVSRRDFVQSALVGTIGVGLARPSADGHATSSAPSSRSSRAQAPMRILILGGTGFIGPHQVRSALERGHSVTLFNRGRTNPGLFPNVETLIGDRDGGLDVLRGHTWDAVIDNSGFLPRLVRDSARLLADSVDRYLFVSSISVYDTSVVRAGQNEYEAPIATMEDPTFEGDGPYYGPRKALCEDEVRNAFGEDRSIAVRPGIITGTGDRNDRIRHWIARVHRGGEILVPGKPDAGSQLIDAGDLAGWCVRMLEHGDSGIFNAIGPRSPLSMAELVHGIRAISSSEVSFTWVDQEFLAEHDVAPLAYMPWIPEGHALWAFNHLDYSRSRETGVTYRPLADTARDMLDEYLATRGPDAPERHGQRGGLSWEREAEVLAAWHAADSKF